MAAVTRPEAIEAARLALRAPAEAPASAWRVRRLDRAHAAYYLVVVGEARSAEGVVAIDEETGAPRGLARLDGGPSPIAVDADRARAVADADSQAQAELVWQPCQASRSPLYPLWEVRVGTTLAYVDQQARVHRRLDPAGPGGAGATGE